MSPEQKANIIALAGEFLALVREHPKPRYPAPIIEDQNHPDWGVDLHEWRVFEACRKLREALDPDDEDDYTMLWNLNYLGLTWGWRVRTVADPDNVKNADKSKIAANSDKLNVVVEAERDSGGHIIRWRPVWEADPLAAPKWLDHVKPASGLYWITLCAAGSEHCLRQIEAEVNRLARAIGDQAKPPKDAAIEARDKFMYDEAIKGTPYQVIASRVSQKQEWGSITESGVRDRIDNYLKRHPHLPKPAPRRAKRTDRSRSQ
jgi:hypothetical protein